MTIDSSTTTQQAKDALSEEIKKNNGIEWLAKFAGLFQKDLKETDTKISYMRSTFKVGAPL